MLSHAGAIVIGVVVGGLGSYFLAFGISILYIMCGKLPPTTNAGSAYLGYILFGVSVCCGIIGSIIGGVVGNSIY